MVDQPASRRFGPNEDPSQIVGRSLELSRLRECFELCCAGERQTLFIAGDAGIGKSTLIRTFLDNVSATCEVISTSGQCLHQFGAGESYHPILDALGRLCLGEHRDAMSALLKQRAPSWAAQLPGLVDDPDELVSLQERFAGTSQERMLRELAESLELACKDRPFILFLEDLQWSDESTLRWLALNAARHESARQLVIATHRPNKSPGSPLERMVHELSAKRQCESLRLAPFARNSVREYLTERFTGAVIPPEMVDSITRRSAGNPLFLTNIADVLVRDTVIVRRDDDRWSLEGDWRVMEHGIPDSIRHFIELQIDQLTVDQQRLLEIGSMEGIEFAAATVAACAELDCEATEDQLDEVVQRSNFISFSGEVHWPDGVCSSAYRFHHDLYRQVFYERIAASRLARFHRRIGDAKWNAYEMNRRSVVTELAMHFELGRAANQAIECHAMAATASLNRCAGQEASAHLRKAVKLLRRLPDDSKTRATELRLQVMLANSLIVSQGYVNDELELAIQRILKLRDTAPTDGQLLLPAVHTGFGYFFVRAEYSDAMMLADEGLEIALQAGDQAQLPPAYESLGCVSMTTGQFTKAVDCFDRVDEISNAMAYQGALFSHDSQTISVAFGAIARWMLGDSEDAQIACARAVQLARQVGHPHSLAAALMMRAHLSILNDSETATSDTEEAFQFAVEQGTPHWLSILRVFRGWCIARWDDSDQGITIIQDAIQHREAMGAKMGGTSHSAMLADALLRANRIEEGRACVEQALEVVATTRETWHHAELVRLNGELLLALDEGNSRAIAERCFRDSLAIAETQRAAAWQLRARVSLSQLLLEDGREVELDRLMSQPVGRPLPDDNTPEFGCEQSTFNGRAAFNRPLETIHHNRQDEEAVAGDRSADDHPTDSQLRDYVSGRMQADQAWFVERHLHQCQPCSDKLDQFAEFEQESFEELLHAAASSSPGAQLAVGDSIDKYQIVQIVGQGGMGSVYEAADPTLARRLAIKLVPACNDESHGERFLREARAVASLSHPHVVTVYAAGSTDDHYFLAMEFVEGGSVADDLIRSGPLPWDVALRMMVDACTGLDAAHQMGLVHRDIKPGNLLLTNEGRVKVADFGLATTPGAPTLTGSNRLLGTPHFMSPEQCRGETVDVRTDIYSLGATLFAMLTGKKPFEESSGIMGVIYAHCEKSVPDACAVDSSIPKTVSAIITRAMEKQPTRRYATCGELATDLRSCLD